MSTAPSTVVVKLGGSTLQDAAVVESICGDIAQASKTGLRVILVHGGGPAINEELTRRGITWEFFEGQRITTPEMMDVIDMVLCGTVNRRIVKKINALGVAAVGFSGVDHSTLLCRKADERLGQVGVIEHVNTDWISTVLSGAAPAIPVLAPIGFSKDGATYNVNADWAATKVASAMRVSKLIFLTDQDGILDGSKKLISRTDPAGLHQLIETGVVLGGMLAKTRTILSALENGVRDVHILNAKRSGGLLEALRSENVGTTCGVRT